MAKGRIGEREIDLVEDLVRALEGGMPDEAVAKTLEEARAWIEEHAQEEPDPAEWAKENTSFSEGEFEAMRSLFGEDAIREIIAARIAEYEDATGRGHE